MARLFLVTIMGTINWHPPELTAFEMLWISDNGAKVTSYTAACLLVRVFVLFLFFLDGTCKSSCVVQLQSLFEIITGVLN